jgi:GMP synthase-like glutamine amidotransferase
MHISRTSAGEDDPAFGPLPNPLKVLQWHGAEVTELPVGAAVLASSDACGIQAFRFGQHAYGMQFHVEVTAETVVNWGAIPEYAQALETAMGPGAVKRLDHQVSAELSQFNKNARSLYGSFKTIWSKLGCSPRG